MLLCFVLFIECMSMHCLFFLFRVVLYIQNLSNHLDFYVRAFLWLHNFCYHFQFLLYMPETILKILLFLVTLLFTLGTILLFYLLRNFLRALSCLSFWNITHMSSFFGCNFESFFSCNNNFIGFFWRGLFFCWNDLARRIIGFWYNIFFCKSKIRIDSTSLLLSKIIISSISTI
jgi:hypothetical protein